MTKFNPLKDIIIATSLGVLAGTWWNTWKKSELDRTTQFYKWYEGQQAIAATISAENDDEDD